MRIAILIGISEYQNISNLPGCDNDINAVSEVLNSSKEFDEIKIFSKNVKSNKVKLLLSTMFEEWKGNKIDELFFYFSGHGSYINDDFYYLLSDFNEDQKRQTSLQNSEVDNMIRSIKPKMVIKIIDACQSGISYVKTDINIIEKYYNKTTNNFEKCYFLHSSMTSQYSYQSEELSYFTRSFLNAINQNNKTSIRYKDIIDFISDEFEKSTEQTPFFITQADHTEKFLDTSLELQRVILKYVKEVEKEHKLEIEDKIEYNSYVDKIKKNAEIYSNQKETKELLTDIKKCISETELQSELKELYCYNHHFSLDIEYLPKVILIGKWLQDNTNDYFAKPYYEEVSYEEEIKPNPIFSSMMRGSKIVTKYRNELKGFSHPLDIPYKYIIIEFSPLFPNLKQHALLLTFLISKKEIKFFYAFTNYGEIDWVRKEINTNFKWSSTNFLIKENDKILEFIKRIITETENKLITIIKEEFGDK